jgi:hypothetical protein
MIKAINNTKTLFDIEVMREIAIFQLQRKVCPWTSMPTTASVPG